MLLIQGSYVDKYLISIKNRMELLKPPPKYAPCFRMYALTVEIPSYYTEELSILPI